MEEASGLVTVNRNQIVKEGWLEKLGEYQKNWKSRYFVLLDNGTLYGFQNKPDEFCQVEPISNLTIKSCQIMLTNRPKPYTFRVKGIHWNTVVEKMFCVETEQEMEDWMASIKMVSERIIDGQNKMIPANSEMVDLCEKFSLQGTSISKSTGKQKVTFECFELLKLLGRGSFGKVILCREKATGQIFATKFIKKELLIKQGEVAHTRIENRVLRSTNHPFLTSLKYSFETSDMLCFVMEYVNGGDLFFHLSREGVFSEERTKFYGAEIISAIAYLHTQAIIYRDMKPENLLLDREGHIKITDFGLCKDNITYGKTTNSFCGTPEYLAPEVIKNYDYNQAVDWWGTGVVIYEMVCGRLPFSHNCRETLYELIVMEEVKFPSNIGNEAKDLLAGLLVKDSKTRLGGGPQDAKEIMVHPFFSNINWKYLEQKKIPPPFKPQVTSDTDTQYFDCEFTEQRIRLTAPEQEHQYFLNFSFQDSR